MGDEIEQSQSERIAKLPKIDRSRMKMARPNLSEMISVESGGKNYQLKMEPRCKVCKKGAEVVGLVNTLLSTGATYADVLRNLEALNATYPESQRISYNSLVTHQKKHMPYEAYAVREIIEARAEQTSKDFIEGKERLVDAASYARVMMEKGFQTLANPAYVVDPVEGLQAAKLYHALMQDESGSLDAAQALSNLGKIIEAVKKVCTDEQMERIVSILDGDGDIVDADIVEVDPMDDFDDEEDYDPDTEDESTDDERF